jgi:hypothetical protein
VRIAAGEVHHGLAAIGGLERADVQDIDGVLVLWIGGDMGVVERALTEIASLIHQLPRGATIVGAEESAVFVLDDCVNAIQIGSRYCDADFSDDAARQAGVAGDFGPVLATVG